MAQLLFLWKCIRRDIQTAVSFLTTIVKRLDRDNWGKLKHVLQYLCSTHHMKLNLFANNLTPICWWVDASHATHDDCRGHISAMMSLGEGATISFSNILTITTKSSTKSKLTSADQALLSILHTCYFIEAQGHSVKQNILFQDDQSSIHLKVNSSFSSSKQSKQIKCRYFFIMTN